MNKVYQLMLTVVCDNEKQMKRFATYVKDLSKLNGSEVCVMEEETVYTDITEEHGE